MMKFASILLAGVAAFTLATSTVSASQVATSIEQLRADAPNLSAGFSDDQLFHQLMLATEARFESEYGLRSRWTGDQYAERCAQMRLKEIRGRYAVSPGFTRQQMIDNRAARELNDYITEYDLSAGFTESELILKKGARRALWAGVVPLNLFSEPVGAQRYAEVVGPYEAHRLSVKWGLSSLWSFEELRAMAGPEEAAALGRKYDFRAGMSHDEIVAAIGRVSAHEQAESLHLPDNYTAEELVLKLGKVGVETDVRGFYGPKDSGDIDEAWLVAHMKAHIAEDIDKEFAGLSGNFTEKQLLDYLIKQADAQMRDKYGFVGSYEEYDVAKAFAESYIAELRQKLQLPLHFTEDQVKAAMKDHAALGAYYWH